MSWKANKVRYNVLWSSMAKEMVMNGKPEYTAKSLQASMTIAEMSSRDVANLCGVSPRAVQLWLNGERPVPVLVRRVLHGIALGAVSRRTLEGLALLCGVLVLSALPGDAEARSRRSHGPSSGYAPSYSAPPVRHSAPVRRGPSPLWVVPLMGGGSSTFCWDWNGGNPRRVPWVTCY